MKKSIEHILHGRIKQITREETVLQPLPHKDFRFANPFIVLHHKLPELIAAGSQSRIHPHPHRGFAPVTFMLQGQGYHKDSAGHSAVIDAGDVQWMFAGKGILHSEGPSTELLERGGIHEFIQLWINVPAVNKMDEPSYQVAKALEQPVAIEQDGVQFRIASGQYDGKTGPIKTLTPIVSMFGQVEKGRRVQLTATPGYWTLLYVVNGSVNINMESVEANQLVVFEQSNDEVIVCAKETAQLLYLSALPIQEPVAAKDNFVMNSSAEIELAMQDYADGLFGKLTD